MGGGCPSSPAEGGRAWLGVLFGEAVLHSNTISVSGLLKLIGYIYLSIYLSINLIYLLI